MHGFNPFRKPVADLEPDDLGVLFETSEGWSVEYKSQVPDVAGAAKSISAFANSYGGWLFYGVLGNDKDDRSAKGFPGLAAPEVAKVEERLTKAATDALDPHPIFETAVLYGPCQKIGLSKDRAIVAVYVHMGANAPYVHTNGRIYRRVADASDPTFESDRYFLDKLWERGEKARREFVDRIQKSHEKCESHTSYLTLWFFADTWGHKRLQSVLDFDRFVEIVNRPGRMLCFDNAFPSATGFVARQAQRNPGRHKIFSWEAFYDVVHKVTFPINIQKIDSAEDLVREFNDCKHLQDLLRLYREKNRGELAFLDLSMIWLALQGVYELLFDFQDIEEVEWPWYLKIAISNVGGCTPFLDFEDYIGFVSSWGFPLVQSDQILIPPRENPDSCLTVQLPLSSSEEQSVDPRFSFKAVNSFTALTAVARGLGLPPKCFGMHSQSDESSRAKTSEIINRLVEMGNRTNEAAQRRHEASTKKSRRS